MIETPGRPRDGEKSGSDRDRGTGWSVAVLLQRMADRGTAPAVMTLSDGNIESHTYAEVSDLAQRLAGGLAGAGIGSGEPVAIFAPNGAVWIVLALALGRLGAVAVPIDDLAEEAEAGAILADSGARRVFSSPAHLPFLTGLAEVQELELFILDGEAEAPARSWRCLLGDSPASLLEPAPEQPACLFYTSGTTGAPKGFFLSHANIAANVEAIAATKVVAPGDRALLPLPLHHAYPFIVGMLTSFQSGMALVLPESATGPHIVRALKEAKVTAVIGVPRLYAALAAGIRSQAVSRGGLVKALFLTALRLARRGRGPLAALGRWLLRPVRRRIGPDLRLLVSGGAELEEGLWRDLEALGWRVLSGFGLAETSSVFTGNLPWDSRPGSAGKPLGVGRMRIADSDPQGQGEIQLYGPSITAGYRDNPEANRQAFTDDGWFRTGDLGYIDDDGFLFVTGRIKEAIVLGGGKKVSPEDLEKRFEAKAAIEEIAILEREGRLVALVRPDMDAIRKIGTLDVPHAVRVALAETGKALPAYQQLAGFELTRLPLPRTRLGKIRRFLLPGLYDQAGTGAEEAPEVPLSAADQALLAKPPAARAWALIAERYAERRPAIGAHLALDLGVDSLEWMTLALELEAKLGVSLSDGEVADIDTVRDLLQAVVTAAEAPATAAPDRDLKGTDDQERWLRPTGPLLAALHGLLLVLDKLLMRAFFRLRVSGRGNVPATGPFVVAANHASDLDPLLIAAALPYRTLRCAYWGGDVVRLFDSAAGRLFCRTVHVFPVDERAASAAIGMAAAVLGRGDVQIWFPEGWRSPDGRLQRFLPGIGQLLLQTRAPVLPVHIAGSFEAMPRTRRWPRPHPVRITIGSLVEVSALEAEGEGETPQARIIDGLHGRLSQLAEEA